MTKSVENGDDGLRRDPPVRNTATVKHLLDHKQPPPSNEGRHIPTSPGESSAECCSLVAHTSTVSEQVRVQYPAGAAVVDVPAPHERPCGASCGQGHAEAALDERVAFDSCHDGELPTIRGESGTGVLAAGQDGGDSDVEKGVEVYCGVDVRVCVPLCVCYFYCVDFTSRSCRLLP